LKTWLIGALLLGILPLCSLVAQCISNYWFVAVFSLSACAERQRDKAATMLCFAFCHYVSFVLHIHSSRCKVH
jgi:hypothetical protein